MELSLKVRLHPDSLSRIVALCWPDYRGSANDSI